MPILSVFVCVDNVDSRHSFLGSCRYTNRQKFVDEKLKPICLVNGWDFDKLVWVHHYLDDLVGCTGKAV